MAVPKKRTTKSKRNARRSSHAATAQKLTPCPRCKAPTMTHKACPTCGTYNGRVALTPK